MTVVAARAPMLAFAVYVVLLSCSPVAAIMQTIQLDVYLGDRRGEPSYTFLVSHANFGSYPKMLPQNNPRRVLTLPPQENPLLCHNITSPQALQEDATNTIMMVPRGDCTFETKTFHAQQLGAQGVIVYGTLASRYTLNETNQTDYKYTEADVVFPKEYFDYDCNLGQAWIRNEAVSMEPLPYNAGHNDPLLQGNTSQNLCIRNSLDHLQNCPSAACLLTGNKTDESREACCAWDFHMRLDADATFNETNVSIPAVYLTMQQGQQLLRDLKEYSHVELVLSQRWRPTYNSSTYLIWALGVAVAAIASYMSAGDYRKMSRRLDRRRERRAAQGRPSRPTSPSRPPPIQQPEDSLELTASHALGFVVLASSGLLLLFYLKIYNFVKVLYAFGCSKAVSQVVATPLYDSIAKPWGIKDRIVWRTNTEDFGDITIRDMVTHVAGYSLGLAWLIVAFTVRHPNELPFFWITQDLFGACMCIMFLQLIKLNSIYVASILMVVAFFYDIFFVFVSPLIFNKSVMITVATSGGPPTQDPIWCEKYPDDRNCQGGDPLPMLLTIPRLYDYLGGSSLLGLGDIVLPGLLLSFVARFDAAKSLLGKMGGGSGSLNSHNCPERRFCSNCLLCSRGYYPPLVLAYAIGLAMANAAVYLMNMGQPALLYLVPACLGTIAFMGWRRGELLDLWEGPKSIRAADDIVYGEVERAPSSGHAPLPVDEGQESAPEVPSAQYDNDGDLSLVQDDSRR